MLFKPLPVLTLFAIPTLVILIGLGQWQLARSEWKSIAIAKWEQMQQVPAISLEAALCSTPILPLQKIKLSVSPAGDKHIQLYGLDENGAPGWRVFQPLPLPKCASSDFGLLETGFIAFKTGKETRRQTNLFQLETPRKPGWFTPGPNLTANQFYSFDRVHMATNLNIDAERLSEEFWITYHNDTLPARLSQTPPERHIGYALTWFGLALTLIGVYLTYHIRLGRLIFYTRKDQ